MRSLYTRGNCNGGGTSEWIRKNPWIWCIFGIPVITYEKDVSYIDQTISDFRGNYRIHRKCYESSYYKNHCDGTISNYNKKEIDCPYYLQPINNIQIATPTFQW